MAAVESGNVNKFIDMIAHKEELNLDIDYVNDNEQTPLQLAIVSGYAGELFPLISLSFFFHVVYNSFTLYDFKFRNFVTPIVVTF